MTVPSPPRPTISDVPVPTLSRAVEAAIDELPASVRETLRDSVARSIPANTLLAWVKDAAYLEAWCRATYGIEMPLPSPPAMVLTFLAHHLYDAAKAQADPEYGMPAAVAARLIAAGKLRVRAPHAPATVWRRLSTWNRLHGYRGLPTPFDAPGVRETIREATHNTGHIPARKSRKPIGRDELLAMLGACRRDTTLRGARDAALLAMMWASGGRRRSEPTAILVGHVVSRPPIVDAETGQAEPVLEITLPKVKGKENFAVYLRGDPARLLSTWLMLAGIERDKASPVFRSLDRRGLAVDSLKPLSAVAVAKIVKRRLAEGGLSPEDYSAHGIRSGFVTAGSRDGIALSELMQMTGHKTMAVAARYYDAGRIEAGRGCGLGARLEEGDS